MPKIVRKPTSEPSEITPPPKNAPSRPPTRAEGSVRNDSSARRVLPNDVNRSKKIAAAAMRP